MPRPALGHQERHHRHRGAGYSGVEAPGERNLAHVYEVNIVGLTFLPPTDFGRKDHPPALWIKRKPPNISGAAIKCHLKGYSQLVEPSKKLIAGTYECAEPMALGLVAVRFDGR